MQCNKSCLLTALVLIFPKVIKVNPCTRIVDMSFRGLYHPVNEICLPQGIQVSRDDTNCSIIVDENGNTPQVDFFKCTEYTEGQEKDISDKHMQTGGDFNSDFRDRNNNDGKESEPVLIYSRETVSENCDMDVEIQPTRGCAMDNFRKAAEKKKTQSPIRSMKINITENKTKTEPGTQTIECHCSCDQTSRTLKAVSNSIENLSSMESLNHKTGRLHAQSGLAADAWENKKFCSQNENKQRSKESASTSHHSTDKESKTCEAGSEKGQRNDTKKHDDSNTVELRKVHRTDKRCKHGLSCSVKEKDADINSKISELAVVDVAIVGMCNEVSPLVNDVYDNSPRIHGIIDDDRVSKWTDSGVSDETLQNTDTDIEKRPNSNLNSYVNLTHRCDELINDLQKQSRDFLTLSTWYSRLRKMFVSLVVLDVLLLGFILIPITIVMKPLSERPTSGASVQNVQKNISTKMERIHGDYVTVTSMVNDLMTRTKSVVQLTSDGQCRRRNSECYLQWSGEGTYRKGSLRLSSSRESIIATSGAFYMIYCKVLFFLRVNTTVDVRFQFEILQRHDTSSVPVYHAIQQMTAVAGSIRHEVHAQITLYLKPGDEIIVSLNTDQASNIARFPAAHALGMLEVS